MTVMGFGIADLKNAFAGERVWLVGNGPSAESWTTEEMRRLGGFVFGMNRCWRESPRTGTGFSDTDFHTFLAGHHFDDLMAGRVESGTVFIPRRFLRLMVPMNRWPNDRRKNKSPIFSINLAERWNYRRFGRPWGYDFDTGSVASTFAGHLALALSVYMGFTEILLVGYDLNNGEGHFFDKSDEKPTSPPNFNREGMVRWFDPVGEWLVAGEHPDVEPEFGAARTLARPLIVNCNPGSAIRVFPFASKQDIESGAFQHKGVQK
jgi:hypothetical protein